VLTVSPEIAEQLRRLGWERGTDYKIGTQGSRHTPLPGSHRTRQFSPFSPRLTMEQFAEALSLAVTRRLQFRSQIDDPLRYGLYGQPLRAGKPRASTRSRKNASNTP
jgi:hypothetical protein